MPGVLASFDKLFPRGDADDAGRFALRRSITQHQSQKSHLPWSDQVALFVLSLSKTLFMYL